jgi:DNA mismatch endonuclease, patch repair protein
MALRLSPEERAERMRSIRKTDTKPELVVRRIAHELGFRFRLHRRDLPGTPDLTFPRHRKVVLVHGCFWHQHDGCGLARQPRRNLHYWGPKLGRNVQRDRRVLAELAALGWTALIIWECETRSADVTKDLLARFMEAPSVARFRDATFQDAEPE